MIVRGPICYLPIPEPVREPAMETVPQPGEGVVAESRDETLDPIVDENKLQIKPLHHKLPVKTTTSFVSIAKTKRLLEQQVLVKLPDLEKL